MSEERGIANPRFCVACGEAVELCEACEREECEETKCFDCLRVELGQSVPQPHSHGG